MTKNQDAVPERFASAAVVDLARQAAPSQGAGPDQAGGPAWDASAVVIDVTDQTFEALVETSKTVPVVIDLWATWCEPCRQLSPVLERVAESLGGRLLLARIDIDAAPQVASAFGVQSVPTVVALIAGQPAPLFAGAQPEPQVRQVFAEVLKVAAEHGVTGSLADLGATPADPAPAQLSPHEEAALAAIERGDLAAAAQAYAKALAENPGDREAKVALEQVELLVRVEGADSVAVLAAAAAAPTDLEAVLAAADVEVAGGAPEAAFERLLRLIRAVRGEDRETVRGRLVEYFDIVGIDDQRVAAARRALAAALF
jgi:putative thioredoxin